MSRVRPWLLLALLACATVAPARAGLDQAITALNALGGIAPGRVVRFDLRTDAAAPARSVYAVVFSFDGVLWAYTSEGGSVPLGPAPAAAHLTPEFVTARLTALSPQLANITVFADTSARVGNFGSALTNGCVIGCIARMLDLLGNGAAIDEAGFVFLQPTATDTSLPSRGHTVLVYRTGEQWFGIDPAAPDHTFRLHRVGLGAPLDPALEQLAQRRHYPLGQVSYLGVSDRALRRLENEVQWQREVRERERIRNS